MDNCARAVHKQTFTTLCVCILGDRILVNPTSGGQRMLGGIFYLHVLVRIYYVIMEVWLPFMTYRICILRLRFSIREICKIVEPLQLLKVRPT